MRDFSPRGAYGTTPLPIPMPAYSPEVSSVYSSSPSTGLSTPSSQPGYLGPSSYGSTRSPSIYPDAPWGGPSFALAAPPKSRARTPSFEPPPLPTQSPYGYGYGLGLSVPTSSAPTRARSPSAASDWRFQPLPQ